MLFVYFRTPSGLLQLLLPSTTTSLDSWLSVRQPLMLGQSLTNSALINWKKGDRLTGEREKGGEKRSDHTALLLPTITRIPAPATYAFLPEFSPRLSPVVFVSTNPDWRKICCKQCVTCITQIFACCLFYCVCVMLFLLRHSHLFTTGKRLERHIIILTWLMCPHTTNKRPFPDHKPYFSFWN